MLRTDAGTLVTHGQVLQGLLLRAQIEADVRDKERPAFVSCRECHAPVPVAATGPIPGRCDVCYATAMDNERREAGKRARTDVARKVITLGAQAQGLTIPAAWEAAREKWRKLSAIIYSRTMSNTAKEGAMAALFA